MKVTALPVVLLLLLALAAVEAMPTQHPGFQIRRPIKYYFHLLELKSKYNPLLHFAKQKPNSCSSKAGPFCSLTPNEPLQTHFVKQLTPQMRNVVVQMEQTVNSFAQTAQSILKDDIPVFLIRNHLHTAYDAHLKQKMGDVMHKQQMLPVGHFEELRSGNVLVDEMMG